MTDPLNINLIIPFKDNKDNKDTRLQLYRNEIERYKTQLCDRVTELQGDLESLFGQKFELTLAPRSDGNARKYYWRFKSSKRDRKYNRLNAETVVEYVKNFEPTRKRRLIEIEEELIYINANLKLIKGIIDAIEQSIAEKEVLINLVF